MRNVDLFQVYNFKYTAKKVMMIMIMMMMIIIIILTYLLHGAESFLRS